MADEASSEKRVVAGVLRFSWLSRSSLALDLESLNAIKPHGKSALTKLRKHQQHVVGSGGIPTISIACF